MFREFQNTIAESHGWRVKSRPGYKDRCNTKIWKLERLICVFLAVLPGRL